MAEALRRAGQHHDDEDDKDNGSEAAQRPKPRKSRAGKAKPASEPVDAYNARKQEERDDERLAIEKERDLFEAKWKGEKQRADKLADELVVATEAIKVLTDEVERLTTLVQQPGFRQAEADSKLEEPKDPGEDPTDPGPIGPRPRGRSRKPVTGQASDSAAPAPLTREAILENLDATLCGGFDAAAVIGDENGQMIVRSHNKAKSPLAQGFWPQHPDITGDFAITGFVRSGSRHIYAEVDVSCAGEQAVAKPIPWDADFAHHDASIDAIKLAKTLKECAIRICAAEGKLVAISGTRVFEIWALECEAFELILTVKELEFILRRKSTRYQLTRRSILGATIPGLAGNYEFYVRDRKYSTAKGSRLDDFSGLPFLGRG